MIESMKDLEKLLKLCRKQGVLEININGVSFKLGDLPVEGAAVKLSDAPDQLDGFPTGHLTPEQLMYYSSGGLPQNDPELKDEAS